MFLIEMNNIESNKKGPFFVATFCLRTRQGVILILNFKILNKFPLI